MRRKKLIKSYISKVKSQYIESKPSSTIIVFSITVRTNIKNDSQITLKLKLKPKIKIILHKWTYL